MTVAPPEPTEDPEITPRKDDPEPTPDLPDPAFPEVLPGADPEPDTQPDPES